MSNIDNNNDNPDHTVVEFVELKEKPASAPVIDALYPVLPEVDQPTIDVKDSSAKESDHKNSNNSDTESNELKELKKKIEELDLDILVYKNIIEINKTQHEYKIRYENNVKSAYQHLIFLMILITTFVISIIYGLGASAHIDKYTSTIDAPVIRTTSYGNAIQIEGYVVWTCLDKYCSIVKISDNIFCYYPNIDQNKIYGNVTLYDIGYEIDDLGRPMCLVENEQTPGGSFVGGIFGTIFSCVGICFVLSGLLSDKINHTNLLREIASIDNHEYKNLIRTRIDSHPYRFDYVKKIIEAEKAKETAKK